MKETEIPGGILKPHCSFPEGVRGVHSRGSWKFQDILTGGALEAVQITVAYQVPRVNWAGLR